MRAITEQDIAPIVNPDKASRLLELVGGTNGIRSTDVSIAKTVLAPGGRVEAHFHQRSIEIYVFTAGSGTMTVDSKETPAGAGSVVFIEIGEIHALVNHGDSDLVFYAISQPTWIPADHLIETDAT